MDVDTTPATKTSVHGDIALDLPSGAKVLQPGDAGTNLSGFKMPGPSVAQTFVAMVGVMLNPKKPVNATRRVKPKKVGGPVQRANLKNADLPVQLTVQRTKQKKADLPVQLTMVNASSRSTLPSPNTQVKDPRRCHCCRAYKKALRQAKAEGKREAIRRLDAQAAYKKAGREFDMMLLRSSGTCS